MKAYTSNMMSGITVQFELKDMRKSDQIELCIMTLRHLGIIERLSQTALKEVDEALEAVAGPCQHVYAPLDDQCIHCGVQLPSAGHR